MSKVMNQRRKELFKANVKTLFGQQVDYSNIKLVFEASQVIVIRHAESK